MKRTFPTEIEVPKDITADQVIRQVSSVYGIKKADIKKKGLRTSVDSRQTACIIIRQTGKSLKETAVIFGIHTRDVAVAQRVVPNKYEGDKFFAERFDTVIANIEAKYGKKEMTKQQAKKLAFGTRPGKDVLLKGDMNFEKAGVFFLEGYNYALKKFKLV